MKNIENLYLEEDYISLEIIKDEGIVFAVIELDDKQKLTLTSFELINLKKILDKNFNEIEEIIKSMTNE